MQQVESLGQRDRVNRYTGGRKAAREEATGSSQKRREAGANQATAPRDPRGMVKATLLEARVPSYLTSYPYFKWEALG